MPLSAPNLLPRAEPAADALGSPDIGGGASAPNRLPPPVAAVERGGAMLTPGGGRPPEGVKVVRAGPDIVD